MHYTLYFLDADDGVERALNLSGADDEAAIAMIEDHPHKHGRELWNGKRLVIKVGSVSGS